MSVISEIVKLGGILLRVTGEYDEDGNETSVRVENIPSPAKEITVPDRVIERK